ncbi:hypothetical protein P3S68_001868 [Capsicum galapagoense]
MADAVTKINILVVEGYLFELLDTIRTISKVCEKSRKNGALVSITASDVSCIERYYDDYWEIMENYANILFANNEESYQIMRTRYLKTSMFRILIPLIYTNR